MKSMLVGISTTLALAGILTATFLALSARVERRAISSSPTLFRGRPYVMKIHDYNSEKKSVVNANVMVELVQSGSLFATYTVELIADPWCKSLPKEASMDFEMGSIPTPLVSGTFGPMSNPKLNLSIADNLELTGRDFCVVISNDRRPSHSLTDAAKANVVIRFQVRTRRGKAFKFLYEPGNQPAIMAISFVIGFAAVFIPLVVASKTNLVDGQNSKYTEPSKTKLPEPKFNRYEGCHRRTCYRNQHRAGLKPEDHQSNLEKAGVVSDLNVPSLKVAGDHETTIGKTDSDPAFDIPKSVEAKKSMVDLPCEDISDDPITENGSAIDVIHEDDKPILEQPLQATEVSDKRCVDADYLVI